MSGPIGSMVAKFLVMKKTRCIARLASWRSVVRFERDGIELHAGRRAAR